MRKEEVISQFKEILFNKGLFNGRYGSYSYDEELEVFYDEAKEIEWQIREQCILIRYCEDTTHTYVEVYADSFNNTYDMIYYALDEALDDLERKYMKKVMAKYE